MYGGTCTGQCSAVQHNEGQYTRLRLAKDEFTCKWMDNTPRVGVS